MKEDIDNIIGSIGSEEKAEGIPDNQESCLNFFISRVRKNLHFDLVFFPIGESFHIRARRFPGLVNCTVIDQFHLWPREALVSVAERFIQDVEIEGPDDVRTQIANHMAEEHLSIAQISKQYLEVYRRYNMFYNVLSSYRTALQRPLLSMHDELVDWLNQNKHSIDVFFSFGFLRIETDCIRRISTKFQQSFHTNWFTFLA